VRQGRIGAGKDLHRLVRELCTLFVALRPYIRRVLSLSDPQMGAACLTDFLYMAHVVLILPYSFQLPQGEHQYLCTFTDFVPQLRKAGENHFLAMLRHQQEEITTALKPCTLSGVLRGGFVASDTALATAVQKVKVAAQGLSVALPSQLLRETAGVLLGVFVRDLLAKFFQVQHLAVEEISGVSDLMMSATTMGSQVLLAAGIAGGSADMSMEEIVDDVPGWSKLCLVSSLLGKDFSGFLQRREEIVRVLSRGECAKLLHLGNIEEVISVEDAWELLNSS